MIATDMLQPGSQIPKEPVNVFTQNPTLPWYRVIPPFSWVTQPKQAKRLRPAGHSAWVEAMHQPVLFLISLAFTSAGLYTLAKDYVAKAFTAIGAGDYGQIVPVFLALFVIVITGGAIEIAFLTAASRLRMHLLRHEWGWTAVSFTMLILTVATEGLTCSYMFYLIEAPKLSPAWLLFMQGIPTLLFFVRAFAGLVCAAYLIIGVLPFVIRPEDVRREMAAEAGAAKVAIIQRLLHVVSELNVMQMLAIYEPIAAIFRDNAGYSSQQMSHRLVLDALGQARTALVAQGATQTQIDAALTQLEDEYRQRGVGAELEHYDEQTHQALTRLQDNAPPVDTTSQIKRLNKQLQAMTVNFEEDLISLEDYRKEVRNIAAEKARLQQHTTSSAPMLAAGEQLAVIPECWQLAQAHDDRVAMSDLVHAIFRHIVWDLDRQCICACVVHPECLPAFRLALPDWTIHGDWQWDPKQAIPTWAAL